MPLPLHVNQARSSVSLKAVGGAKLRASAEGASRMRVRSEFSFSDWSSGNNGLKLMHTPSGNKVVPN